MQIIESEKLIEFYSRLYSLSRRVEDHMYLIRRILNEIELDDLYSSESVNYELLSALKKLERINDILSTLTLIYRTLSSDYIELMQRHMQQLSRLEEYVDGLRVKLVSLSDESHKQRPDLPLTDTSPIRDVVYEKYAIVGVKKDG